MNPVEYIVRDASGSARGGFFPEDNPSSIFVSGAKDVSLNVGVADVASYQKVGGDLVLVLNDGQTIVLDGYYDAGATGAKNLFLSEAGQLVVVSLDEGQDGVAQASYEAVSVGEKWSAYDELVFLDLDRVEPGRGPACRAADQPSCRSPGCRRGGCRWVGRAGGFG